jgi:hypothetical protein
MPPPDSKNIPRKQLKRQWAVSTAGWRQSCEALVFFGAIFALSYLRFNRDRSDQREIAAPERAWKCEEGAMARRIDKIEKEIGYCEIKLEKERRIRKQVQFLQDDIEILDQLLHEYVHRGCETKSIPETRTYGVAAPKTSRDGFLAVGLIELLKEERDILAREREELVSRLRAFSGFETKRGLLEDEKRNALKKLSPAHSSKLRRINDDYKRIERQWNAFTEDMVNLDEGIFFLDRNLDYLRSARTLLISAKGNFDIDFWVGGGILSNLFRHSSIGRAKEMADGADRNLKMAQKELVCVSTVNLHPDLLQRVLLPLLEGLFEDIFIEGKLQVSFRVIEAALATNLKVTEQVKAKRSLLASKLEQVDKMRNQIFTRLGADKRGRLVG